eukprot:1661574-Rhodomonas_salina.1
MRRDTAEDWGARRRSVCGRRGEGGDGQRRGGRRGPSLPARALTPRVTAHAPGPPSSRRERAGAGTSMPLMPNTSRDAPHTALPDPTCVPSPPPHMPHASGTRACRGVGGGTCAGERGAGDEMAGEERRRGKGRSDLHCLPPPSPSHSPLPAAHSL